MEEVDGDVAVVVDVVLVGVVVATGAVAGLPGRLPGGLGSSPGPSSAGVGRWEAGKGVGRAVREGIQN